MRPPDADRRLIAESLRLALADRAVSQKEMATRLSVTETTVSNWVTARNDPAAGWLPKVARELGMSVAELLDFAPSSPLSGHPPDPLAAKLAALAPVLEPLARATTPDLLDLLQEAQKRVQDLG